MNITIDQDSPVPPYEQVRLSIAALAAAGELAAGTKLPPVRQLATDLGLAANTVARAYRELEHAGLVETRGRAGTVLTSRAAGTSRLAQQAAAAYAAQTRALGIPSDQALALVQAALNQ
ncbi:DNA-binding transcriptional regulator YhcF (GntR family) [Actinoplanes lutulentus]|uniref:GntR family transcriptional regulator n=1 Tax=Actinoplanes lutulentus TaxID=1287878 RepID=A0A327Z4S0_9ACTN|nr:GntR family transcriptional regulator [Actinoplanes lutulentus]MBB2948187.1 DNA-binding transcriptional regulator YhcF (GntR family) [Actinoplanes lutulentus]RAK31313.1 GntR family transcriptional regulator [Actinoplanes lutulentus]